MHSSGMRTVRCSGRLGRCLPTGGVHPRGQTDVCENITFPQLLLRTVNIDTTTQDGGCLGQ